MTHDPDNKRQSLAARGTASPSFTAKLTRVVVVTGLAFLLVLLVWFEIRIPLLFFGGVIISAFIRGMSLPVSRITRLPVPVSVVLVLVALAAVCWFAGSYLAPHVGKQYDTLKAQLPAAIKNVETQLAKTTMGSEMMSRLPSPGDLLSNPKVQKEVKNFFSITFGALADAFILFFAGLYLTFNPDVYIRGIIRIVPSELEDRTAHLFDVLAVTLRRWILGRLVCMAIVGLITGIGLWLIGVPLALSIGLLSGVLTFIPYLGAVISAIPAVLLALLADPVLALWVVFLYLGAHAVEAYIVTPLMQQHQVQVPPVLTLLGQVVMASVAGLLGLMLATPLIAVVLVVIKVLYIEDVLGKKTSIPGIPGGG